MSWLPPSLSITCSLVLLYPLRGFLDLWKRGFFRKIAAYLTPLESVDIHRWGIISHAPRILRHVPLSHLIPSSLTHNSCGCLTYGGSLPCHMTFSCSHHIITSDFMNISESQRANHFLIEYFSITVWILEKWTCRPVSLLVTVMSLSCLPIP